MVFQEIQNKGFLDLMPEVTARRQEILKCGGGSRNNSLKYMEEIITLRRVSPQNQEVE